MYHTVKIIIIVIIIIKLIIIKLITIIITTAPPPLLFFFSSGLGLGYKVFIIDNVYRKYPKVKEKYDGVARMWRSLPTNNELVQRQRMTEEDMVRVEH